MIDHVVIRCLIALSSGLLGGWIAQTIDIPMPWLIGSMIGCMIPAVAGFSLHMPDWLTQPVRPVIGVVLGAGFSPALLNHLTELGVSLLILPIYVVVITACCMIFLQSVGRLDRKTAYFASVPGGLSDMAIIGADMGADARIISLLHASRVTIVIFTVPWIVTYLTSSAPGDIEVVSAIGAEIIAPTWSDILILTAASIIGWRLAVFARLPAGLILGPMIITAILYVSGSIQADIPDYLSQFAQYILGCSLGSRFVGTKPALVGRILALSVGQILISLFITLILCIVISYLLETSLVLNLLSYAPGGFAEMSLMALALDHDVGWVTTHHSIRIFIVIFTAPILIQLFGRHNHS